MQGQSMNQCTGIYLGKVIQHLSHGQLKVYIHGVYPVEWETKPELLPICMQITPQFAGSNNGNGVFSYPNIGSTVVCMFANGDQNLPLALGSLLGGENAFGQYEHIKNRQESISNRHLITSGKSHIEIFESGKISATVVDPIRTDADVQYNNSPNAELSTNAVTGRPICEKVDSKEISSINCQFVIDNKENNGTISSSTHWYNPLNSSTITHLSAEGKTITDISKGQNQYDSYQTIDNAGSIYITQLSSIEQTSSHIIASEQNEQTIIPLTANASISEYRLIDGQQGCDISKKIIDNYAYNNSTANIISSHSITDDANSSIFQTITGNLAMTGLVKHNIDEQYNDNANTKMFTAKQKLANDIMATSESSIILQTLSSNNSVRTEKTPQLSHTNNYNASGIINIKSNNGIYINSSFSDNDIKTVGGSTTSISSNNIATYDISINPNVYSDQFIHQKYTKIIGGTTTNIDVQCQSLMSPSDGKFDLKIENNQTGQYCKILMDDAGNMTIDASKSLTIKAPTITVIGTTLNETFNDITISATNTLNITGLSGDCTIQNVSLLNHAHMETQSGDVVSPQLTQSAVASN